MPIVSSTHTVGHAQRDGRRYVVELHTDSTGKVHRVEYGPVSVVDYVAIRSARAAALADHLAETEFFTLLGTG